MCLVHIYESCINSTLTPGIRQLAPNTDSILKRCIWFHLCFVSIVLLMKWSHEIFFSYLTIFDNIKSINFIVNLFNNNLFLIFSCDWDLILSICTCGLSIYLLESTNTAPSNLKYNISMKGIVFTYHLAWITDHWF